MQGREYEVRHCCGAATVAVVALRAARRATIIMRTPTPIPSAAVEVILVRSSYVTFSEAFDEIKHNNIFNLTTVRTGIEYHERTTLLPNRRHKLNVNRQHEIRTHRAFKNKH